MRNTLKAAAVAASLTLGGAAGAALFVPTFSAAQESGTTQTDETAETEDTTEEQPRDGFLADALAPLVEAGTIDQSQADAVIEAIRDARPAFGHRHRGPFGEALAEVLGMTRDELRAAIDDGRTVPELAEDAGVSTDEIVAALLAPVEEHLAEAVEDGRLTDEEAAEKLAEATERATAIATGEAEPGSFRGGHRHGPHGFGSAPT
jgi:hypothetical protein